MLADVTIRQFQSTDAASVIALWQRTLPSPQPWNDPSRAICRKRNQMDDLFFVGDLDGTVIATVLMVLDWRMALEL